MVTIPRPLPDSFFSYSPVPTLTELFSNKFSFFHSLYHFLFSQPSDLRVDLIPSVAVSFSRRVKPLVEYEDLQPPVPTCSHWTPFSHSLTKLFLPTGQFFERCPFFFFHFSPSFRKGMARPATLFCFPPSFPFAVKKQNPSPYDLSLLLLPCFFFCFHHLFFCFPSPLFRPLLVPDSCPFRPLFLPSTPLFHACCCSPF